MLLGSTSSLKRGSDKNLLLISVRVNRPIITSAVSDDFLLSSRPGAAGATGFLAVLANFEDFVHIESSIQEVSADFMNQCSVIIIIFPKTDFPSAAIS